MTLRSGPLLFDRPPRSARRGVQNSAGPFALNRGTRHAIHSPVPSNGPFGVFGRARS